MSLFFNFLTGHLRTRQIAAVGLLACLTWPAAGSETPFSAERCIMPVALTAVQGSLPLTAARIARGEAIKIVALGSSSTSGAGASTEKATYPSHLEAELRRMLPKLQVTVLNKGVSGDRVEEMMARMQRDVIDQRPDLLVWQVGTNSALNGDDPGRFVEELVQGLERVRGAGIDVVMMTPQFSPRFENTRTRKIFIDQITAVAELRGIPVVRRYEMMKHWIKSGRMTRTEMINPDGLHLTDLSYYCVGLQTARLIAKVTHAPVAVADIGR